MKNIIFSRDTLKAVGANRAPMPFEVSINHVVDTDKLNKEVTYFEEIQKVVKEEIDGEIVEKPLYLLPQEDKEIVSTVPKTIESTEVTDNPIMEVKHKRVPLLDDSGNQIQYELTVRGEITEDTGEPVMIEVSGEDEFGNLVIDKEQKKDENGNLLFWGQVGTGTMIDCWTTEEVEEQKVDAEGNKLYWLEVEEEVTTYAPQPSLEVTEDDERWTEELEPAMEQIEKTRVAEFNAEPHLFTYHDVATHKQALMTQETLFINAKLFESFTDVVEDAQANFGFGFVNLNQGDYLITRKIETTKTTMLKVYIESSQEGLTVEFSSDGVNFTELNKYNEVFLSEPVEQGYIKVSNNTDESIDVNSLGLMW